MRNEAQQGRRAVRVLVVDDSAFMRKALSEMLQRNSGIQVIGSASDGREALERIEELKPDVVLLDLFMPSLDGVGFLREQMKRRPLPVVICSSAGEQEDATLAAMEAGAVEFVQKPTYRASEQVYQVEDDLIQKVLAAGQVSNLSSLQELPTAGPQLIRGHRTRGGLVDAVVIGLSTGGPQALRKLLRRFPGDFSAPVAIVQHMPEGYTRQFAERLDHNSELEVVEAVEGMEMRPGRAILAMGGRHLVLQRQATGLVTARLPMAPLEKPHRPSVDVLFESAAKSYEKRLLGVVMTGMGNDGTAGAASIKAQGGLIYAEAEQSSIIYGMPRSVVEAGLADRIIPLEEMPEAILEVI